MIRKLFNSSVVLGLLMACLSCQKLQPEQITVPEYPNLESFYKNQVELLHTVSLKKTVSLEGKSETITFKMDTSKWQEELSFLKEINPNQPEYLGIFEKTVTRNLITLALKPNESGILKELKIELDNDEYQSISAIVHEEKDVYIHHRDLKIILHDGSISSYEINGYQKMILRDTVRFQIIGSVVN